MLRLTQSLSLCLSFLESLATSQVTPAVHKQHSIRDIQTFDTNEVSIGQNTYMSGTLTTDIPLAVMTHFRISQIGLIFAPEFLTQKCIQICNKCKAVLVYFISQFTDIISS